MSDLEALNVPWELEPARLELVWTGDGLTVRWPDPPAPGRLILEEGEFDAP